MMDGWIGALEGGGNEVRQAHRPRASGFRGEFGDISLESASYETWIALLLIGIVAGGDRMRADGEKARNTRGD